LSLKS